jgi:hypothetical protein
MISRFSGSFYYEPYWKDYKSFRERADLGDGVDLGSKPNVFSEPLVTE